MPRPRCKPATQVVEAREATLRKILTTLSRAGARHADQDDRRVRIELIDCGGQRGQIDMASTDDRPSRELRGAADIDQMWRLGRSTELL